MGSTGDPRASWLTDSNTETAAPTQTKHDEEAYGSTVTGDPRGAFVGGHAGEVEKIPQEPKEPKEYEVRQTMSGDPRVAAFGGGYDTTAPQAAHAPKDTGVYAPATGDPRAAWMGGGAEVDPLEAQEQRDIRRAIAESLKDQKAGGGAAETESSGDPRASWLSQDTAHGGRHNWSKKEAVPEPGDIRDPRAFG